MMEKNVNSIINFPNEVEIEGFPFPIKAKPGELVTMRSEFYWKVSEDGKRLIRLEKIATKHGHEFREVESGKVFKGK